jgi:hypothetical protein
MPLCCPDPYQICQPFPACPFEAKIVVPVAYAAPASIHTIVYKKSNNTAIGWTATPDLIYQAVDLPMSDPCWLNQYGGTYLIKFFDISDFQNPIAFTAQDGKVHNSISFTIGAEDAQGATIIINAFS